MDSKRSDLFTTTNQKNIRIKNLNWVSLSQGIMYFTIDFQYFLFENEAEILNQTNQQNSNSINAGTTVQPVLIQDWLCALEDG